MLIIIDSKSPEESKQKLKKYGDLIEFSTSNITYYAISGHPDVFLCKANNQLIVAPNTPEKFQQLLLSKGINFIKGVEGVGKKYPSSAIYNALVTETHLIHNIQITDKAIIEQTSTLKAISVKQGYTKCNLLALGNNTFITSDIGIFITLKKLDFNVLYVIPENLILPGFTNGFFGGTCGISDNILFINGNLDFYPEGRKVRKFLKGLKYKIVELYKGPLFDGGSILFLESK
jgi:hypothetical protein